MMSHKESKFSVMLNNLNCLRLSSSTALQVSEKLERRFPSENGGENCYTMQSSDYGQKRVSALKSR